MHLDPGHRGTHRSTRTRVRSAPMMVAALLLLMTACDGSVESGDSPRGPYAGSVAAPDFPAGLAWLNTGGDSLTLADFRGKVVALHFWTDSCVNCAHTQAELERLLAEFPETLEVVGVHVPRLPYEATPEAARQAVIQRAIDQPTVHDPDLRVWDLWDGSVLPTTTVVDPAGNVVGRYTGEGVSDALRPVVVSLLDEFEGAIDRTRVERRLEREARLPTILSYPAGIAVDATNDVVYIADTANHRIVAASLPSGDVLAVYGDGRPAARDGEGADASFSEPRGLALSDDGATLYVADPGSHTIRAVHIGSGRVSTVAGTGELGPVPAVGGLGTDVALRSPRDVEIRGTTLYVGMAGSHQIWRIDLATGDAEPFAGSGVEGRSDGAADAAELSQPSGLALDPAGRWLYFTDAGSTSVRRLDLERARVDTLAGADLSSDGTDQLQHPVGIGASAGEVVIADSYGHQLVQVSPDDGSVSARWGGPAGWRDGTDPRFYQPEALDITASTVFVADTFNHAIRLIDLGSGSTTTLVLRGIEAFQPVADDEDYRGTVVELPGTAVAAGEGRLVIDISLPPGHKVNEQAPSSIAWKVDGAVVDFPAGGDPSLTGVTFPVPYEVAFLPGEGTLTADIDLFWCANDAESLCFIEQLRLIAPLSVAESGSDELILSYRVSLPEITP